MHPGRPEASGREADAQPGWGSTKTRRGSSQTLVCPTSRQDTGYRTCAQHGQSASVLLRFPWSGPTRKEAPSSLQGILLTETEVATEPEITPHLSFKLADATGKPPGEGKRASPLLAGGLPWEGMSWTTAAVHCSLQRCDAWLSLDSLPCSRRSSGLLIMKCSQVTGPLLLAQIKFRNEQQSCQTIARWES